MPRFTCEQIDSRAKILYEKMHETGIPINLLRLKSFIIRKQQELVKLKSEVNQVCGFIPNPNQVHDWQRVASFFGETLPVGSRGPKTDEFTVRRFRKEVPLLLKMAEARRVRRDVSIAEKLMLVVVNRAKIEKRCTVHPTYYMNSELGRTHSGGEANPMNWTVDYQLMVQEEGRVFCKADYKALELTVLAQMSQDPVLLEDLKGDVHTQVAKTVYHVEEINSEQRDVAKIVTYGTMYLGDASTVMNPVNDFLEERF